MRKLVWLSDLHWGLSTDEIDRNDEITSVAIHVAKHAVKIKASWFVFGGDLFHNNQPSEELISRFLRVLNILTKANIRVFVMDGNHDKYSKSNRKSALQFLERLKPRYPNVRWIHDVTTLRVIKGRFPCYFTFFPHIVKVHIPKEFKTPQEYVDACAEKIIKKLNLFSHHFVFSHLNVRGAVPGSEEDMLKKSEIFLPDHFHTTSYIDKPIPITLNGHIHSAQQTGYVRIVGSPIYVSFGEKDEHKYFAEVDVPENGDELANVKLIPTPCRPFVEISIDVKSDAVMGEYEKNQIIAMGEKIHPDAIVKLNVTVPESHSGLNWEEIRKEFAKHCYYVKPIIPKIIRDRVKRNRKQTIRLNPNDAVKLFVETNKPKDGAAIVSLAQQYLERLL